MLKLNEETFRLTRGKIGLISDTHGLMRPEALVALKGSELIIHAGDIGKREVLDSLNSIAPVIAIRGNNDRESWARDLPDVLNLKINAIKIHVIHNVNEMEIDPASAGFHAVISGHSHKPSAMRQGNVSYVNPGSAGPRRFKLPIAVAKLQIIDGHVKARIMSFEI